MPADGVIESGASSLDESTMTGETQPVARCVGDAVTGGSQNIESPLTLRITHAGRDTRVAGILDLTDRAFASRPRIALKSARLAHHFVLQVLLIAAVVALAGGSSPLTEPSGSRFRCWSSPAPAPWRWPRPPRSPPPTADCIGAAPC